LSEPIERPESLGAKVHARIKEKILACELPPGEQIVETRLAEQLGVSRTPVHQAVSQLAQEGFVRIDARGNAWVADADPRDVQEIVQLREILETHVVRETAPLFTPDELTEMETMLSEADALLRRGDVPAFLKTNRNFHHFFDRKFGNRYISDVLDRLDNHLYRILSLQFHAEPSALWASQRDHESILQSLRQGAVDSAVARMREHVLSGAPELRSD
jgi:DNA-binding GntR family transcriptional regulator